jgi:multisubunit Na+/H+ antiporter MnhB subunit
MAQTRRKRRSKHRGTAAGTIETRGRTGRKPEPAAKGRSTTARQARGNRLDRAPSWRSAANRGALTTVLFVLAVILVFHSPPGTAFALGAFMLLIYIPMGYYTDLFIYRRRQRQKAAREGKS